MPNSEHQTENTDTHLHVRKMTDFITQSLFIIFALSQTIIPNTETYPVTFFASFFNGSFDVAHSLQPVFDVVSQRIKKKYPLIADEFSIVLFPYGSRNTTCQQFDLYDGILPFYRGYFANSEGFPSDFAGPRGFGMISTSACDERLYSSAAIMAREMPMVGMAMSDADDLFNGTIYPTLINQNTSPDIAYFAALHSLALKHHWRQIILLCESPPNGDVTTLPKFPAMLCGTAQDLLLRLVKGPPLPYVLNRLILFSNSTTKPDYDGVLANDLFSESRAILLLLISRHLKEFMMHAAKKGMTDGNYVFITAQQVGSGGQPLLDWTDKDVNDLVATGALDALLVISSTGVDFTSARVKDFLADVDYISKSKYNLTKRTDEINEASTIHFMDSFFLMAEAVNRTWDILPTLHMASFIERVDNHTYSLLAGDILLNENGMEILPVPVLRFNSTRKNWQTAFSSIFPSFEVIREPGYTWTWFGRNIDLPDEIPKCGIHNDKCQWNSVTDNIKYGPVIVIATVLLLAAITFFVRCQYLKRRYRHLLLDSWCTVKCLQPVKHQSSIRSESKRPEPTEWLVQFDDRQMTGRTVFGVTGSVALFVRKTKENQPFLRKALETYDSRHKNLVLFYGVSLQRAKRELLFVEETCEKGNLKRLLSSNVFLTDILFRLVFIRDIAEGLNFIHKSALSFHGDFSLMNCQVDDRYSIKISQTGYSQMLDLLTGNKRKEVASDRPAQDVQNFGCVTAALIAQGISGNTGSQSDAFVDVSLGLENLISACQDDDTPSRPKMSTIFEFIRSVTRVQGSLVEMLMAKVTKHAEMLQQSVKERTHDLVEETAKVDALLREMLPQYVITKLRNREPLKPEMYESATLLFSDIPLMGDLVNQTSPMVVVEVLNAIYSTLDGAITKFDAYKVETINDSYLVTSGIPERNGSKHAAEICQVALELQCAARSVKIASSPLTRIQLRIGINTGPVATGVVGTRMPRYCIFGDAMNTASRMESHGEPDRIHVGESTVLLISAHNSGQFVFEARGLVPIKGKGSIPTYWLISGGSVCILQRSSPKQHVLGSSPLINHVQVSPS